MPPTLFSLCVDVIARDRGRYLYEGVLDALPISLYEELALARLRAYAFPALDFESWTLAQLLADGRPPFDYVMNTALRVKSTHWIDFVPGIDLDWSNSGTLWAPLDIDDDPDAAFRDRRRRDALLDAHWRRFLRWNK